MHISPGMAHSILLFAIAVFVSTADAGSCRLGADLKVDGKLRRKCQVTGHSEFRAQKTYFGSCENENGQIELPEGGASARLIDATSREEIAKCETDRKAVSQLIQAYQTRNHEIENPKCYLTQWKGQMMVVAEGVKGRCSFNMSKRKSEEFKTKTGVTPLYQCENDYFLSLGEKSTPNVYKRSKNGWELECRAVIRAGEPVEDVDWKNPPAYYVPEAAALRPKSALLARTGLDQALVLILGQ